MNMREPGTAAARMGALGPVRRRWPLRSYLIGLLVLFVATAVAGIGAGWVRARHDAVSAARTDAAVSADLAARQLDESLAIVRGTVDAVASSPGVAQVFADPAACRLAFTLGGSDDGHLDVLRPDGTVACSSRPPAGGEPADGYAGATWLPGAVRAPQAVAPVRDQRTGRPAYLVTAVIPGLGVAAAFVDLTALGAAAGKLFAGARHLEFLITTADAATVLTRWPDGLRWAGTPVRDTRLRAANDGTDVTGLPRLYGRAAVAGTGWQVFAGADRTAALAAADRLARHQSLIVALGLLAGLLATMVVQRRVTAPIGRLRTAVRTATASGDLDTTVAVAGPREVAELGAEFTALLATVGRELQERRRAEDAAREHERNYRQMFDASPNPVVLFDADTLDIVAVNPAAETYYGRPAGTLLTMAYPQLQAPPEPGAEAGWDAPSEPVERDRPQRHVKRDGTVTEVSVTTYLTSFAGRKARCAVVTDVTEREHLQRRLRQSDRLESLGQLAAGVAHDFNNLLGIINGYASMAAADLAPLAAADPALRTLHADLTEIVAAGDRATALTRQLLSFARADPAPETRTLDLNTVIADLDTLLRRALGEDVTLVMQLAPRPWPIRADPGRLEQVLINLAVNARDAMPGGGTLTIETAPVTVDEHYTAQHPGVHTGRYMRLRVSDTGTGMSKETLERAFEPFFTTKPKGHGTGLGLATIYGIITQAGGHTQIYSEPGHGTTITALLPATGEDAEPDTTPAAQHRPGTGETILLVEDDDSLRAVTERVLRQSGYTVLSAGTVTEARDLAAAHPGIALLLTDVILPDMHGPALAAAHPGLPVVYLSGYTETILATRSTVPAGATLLTKPVSAHQLLHTVARVLDHANSPQPH
ncbi:response regulator [Dactylosporangium aurantiacum]|uniref:histidine kinase n=1 Tax=Dactylosporangium aurantiacum TaxID=35754 RepID=A0A9Q9MGE4_9ACTN|nr:ATP-binding protein [Dactylosporangium aurantiacum]MDG6106297.1 ATP-binding protein [Dactylosporangium aurantiacum]UWZ58208.1 response regulator [Dactylosporangium aurantiacum]